MRGKVFKVVFPMVLCLGMLLLPMDILADETQENVQEQQVIMNDETGIPDVNFYNAVLESCDVNGDGVLTTDEVEDLDFLNPNDKGIENIQGIQYFKNLKILLLSDNNISDISALSGMPLTILDLRDNNISDISALSGMPLEHLYLRGNNISDISALTGMSLSSLDLGYNNISDLSALTGMSLTSLSLDHNDIMDISVLSGMLLEHLNLNGNNISDISALSGMPLNSLESSGNNIS
ncbi:MAG: protein phosphatase 1 regulatory subunit 42, partial [Alistipes sp.]|nr:protein phosphatase 1 regulatory subunit 42 [Alistipes sp.]